MIYLTSFYIAGINSFSRHSDTKALHILALVDKSISDVVIDDWNWNCPAEIYPGENLLPVKVAR